MKYISSVTVFIGRLCCLLWLQNATDYWLYIYVIVYDIDCNLKWKIVFIFFILSDICAISGTFEVRFQLFPNCGLIKSIIHSASGSCCRIDYHRQLKHRYIYIFLCIVLDSFFLCCVVHILMMERTLISHLLCVKM